MGLIHSSCLVLTASVRDLAAESLMRFNKVGGFFRGVDVDWFIGLEGPAPEATSFDANDLLNTYLQHHDGCVCQ